MAEDLAGNLANYKLQLQQVNQSLLYVRSRGCKLTVFTFYRRNYITVRACGNSFLPAITYVLLIFISAEGARISGLIHCCYQLCHVLSFSI